MKLNKSLKLSHWSLPLQAVCGQHRAPIKRKKTPSSAIPATGLKLPEGFNATLIADSLGPTRHIAITSQGGIYVKLASPVKAKVL